MKSLYQLSEILAMKLPLVASDVSGVGDLIQNDKDGLLYSRNSPAELTDKLARCIDDPSLAKRISSAGRERVEMHYDRRAIWSRYQRLIRKLKQPTVSHREQANLDSLP